jgi:MFS family permease
LRPFTILLLIGFLWGSSSSLMILLGVILHNHGMAPSAIAAVFSASAVTMIAMIPVAGWLSARHGPLRVIRLAGLFAIAGIAALPFCLDQLPPAMIVNIARGIAAACIMPAGQIYAQAVVGEAERGRAIGMFSLMFMVPNFYAPALTEWLLNQAGESMVFVLALLPLAAAMGLTWLLPTIPGETPKNPAGYLSLITDRRLLLPNLAAAVSGLGVTFATSFLPILLTERHIPVAWFFVPFAAGLLAVRLQLQQLQRLGPPLAIGLALTAYGAGFYVLLATSVAPLSQGAALAAGLCFAVGYGITLPTAIVWATQYTPPDVRARPVALANTIFNVGALIGVQVPGMALPLVGWQGVLVLSGALATLVLGLIALTRRGRAAVTMS